MSNLEEWSMRVEDDRQEDSSAGGKKTGASCSGGEAEQCGSCSCKAGKSPGEKS